MLSSRRRFLQQVGASVPWMVGGSSWLQAEPEVGLFPGLIVRSTEPQNLEFPFAALKEVITPTEQFYVRNHFPVPKLDRKSWKLSIAGAVQTKKEYSYEDLLKLPSTSQIVTLECAGNGRVFLKPSVPGLQWGHGAVGNAKWTGIKLSTLLDQVGVSEKAVEVILEGADKGPVNSDPKSPGPITFARSIPLEKAKSDSAILAYQMNDADLTPNHGYPLRAIIAGWYGMAAIKWLTRIIVVEKPFDGFWQGLDYSYWERVAGIPTLKPITTMLVKSVIARPGLGDVIPAGKPYRLFGAAWAGENRIQKVEVSSDAGSTWNIAKLLEPAQANRWVLWEYAWNVPNQKGPIQLLCRATDDKNNTQPIDRDPDRRSYMINHTIPVDVLIR